MQGITSQPPLSLGRGVGGEGMSDAQSVIETFRPPNLRDYDRGFA